MKITRNRISAIAVAVAAGLTGVAAVAAQQLTPVEGKLKVVEQTAVTVKNKAAIKAANQRQQFTRYIIEFENAPVATYRGGLPGFAATSAQATGAKQLDVKAQPVQTYQQFLLSQQQQVLADIARVVPGLQTERQLTLTFNGAIVNDQSGQLSAAEFKRRLMKVKGVKAVYEDELYYVDMDASNDLINAPEAWALLGGQDAAGQGVNVAVIDTGIDFAHPMFSDNGHDAPDLGVNDDYCASNAEVCNDKLAVARYFPAPSSVHPEEFMDSPMDMNGHGTHVAGTSVGNPVSATFNGVAMNFSGVAPGANLLVYKALWMTADGRGSGLTSSLASALEAAAGDGADVINNSWGGGAGGAPENSPYSSIMKSLDEMGVITVTSAGNSGPGAQTVGCPGCVEETITVASTQTGRMFINELEVSGFGSVSANLGNGDFTVVEPITAELLPAVQVDEANTEACNAFDADAFAGKIALVTRGTCSFEQKANTVQAAGAVGMVLYNNADGIVIMSMGAATLPSVSILQADGLAIEEAYESGMEATINPNTRVMVDANVDILSDFSSRGPNGNPNMLKPEIAAPGSDILSAAPGQGFAMMSGTSMAGPHVAGAAALVRAHNPELLPQQVKSILMTSAKLGVKKEDGETMADAFDVGAGRLELPSALNTAVTVDVASFANPMCLSNCTFERTLTSVVDEATEWQASVSFVDSNMAADFTQTIALEANGSAAFDVTINGAYAAEGWNFGTLTLTDSSGTYADVNMPIAVYTMLSTDSGSLTGGISEGSATTGEDMVTSIVNAMGYTGEEVTLTAQYPTDEAFVLDTDSVTVVETGAVATSSEFDAETRSFTWVGSQTDVPGEVTFTDASTSFAYANLSLDDLAAETPDFSFESVCTEGCDETVLSLDLSAVEQNWEFGGETFTQLHMWENGVVEFGEGGALYTFITQDLPNPSDPNGIVAAFWNDFEVFAEDGEMRYALVSDETDTYLILEWYQVREWNDPTGPAFTFNVWFKLSSDEVYVNLLDIAQGDAPFGTIMGLENTDGSEGGSVSYSASNPAVNESTTALSYAAGTKASVVVNATAQVADFGEVGSASGEGNHRLGITVDLSEAVGNPERSFVTLMSAESGSVSAEAVMPIRIAPNGALQGEVVSAPENGTVNFDGLVATYTANMGFVGEDSFSYRAVDADGQVSGSNTVTVTVTNTAPTVTASAPESADGGDTVELEAVGTDADENALTYTWEQTGGAEVELTGANTALASFTVPELDAESTATFTVTVSDGAAEAEATVSVLLTATETEEPETPPASGGSSSSAFGWLFTLLALPLVWLRRRMV
ncbi:S8 family serine peptidase [Pseudidiomarina woesei]|uniref:Subtilase family n=1 Tax=Pseudidiomarina woesei TaxID=1381080 RepID=A0A0K6GZC6_9GAMM|nr:S8 family serine peptidase [Pseudidiomarina woesei]CUA83878.1 Subtilase family [Pseudidiomarina woesei]